jgi:arylsulfatase A-like enzyme
MKKKAIWAILLLPLFLSVCSKESIQELKIHRLIDNLTAENILLSPLLETQKESLDAQILFPVQSQPLIDQGSGENPFGIKRKIQLGGTDRNILFSPPKTEISYRIKLEHNWTLEFGIGMIQKGNSDHTQDLFKGENRGVTFVVSVETGEKRKILFQKYLPPPTQKEHPAFSWHSIDLPSLQDEAHLQFITEGEKRNTSFWSNPILYQRQAEAQNIILISVDTLRADHLGCYGYQRQTSPHIDSLALDGVTFLNTYASSPWTLPSHVSLLTSLHGVHHQVYYDDESMDPSLVSLADILRQNQLYCAALTGGGFVSSIYGFSKGFDTYSNDAGGVFRQDSAEHLFHLVSEWLGNHKNKRFFLFLHTYQPHNPYACPYPYKTMFLQEGAKWRHLDLLSFLGGSAGIFKVLTEEERQNVVDLYDGEIRYTDEELVGPLIEKLKKMDLYDQSMIVFTSDHGEEFYDHRGWGHGHSLYDESLKVPLIIKFPESRYRGKRISNFVSLVDIFPTILEEIGILRQDLEIDGASLFPVIKGQEKGNRAFMADVASNVLNSHIPQKISLNKGDEKLILNKKFSKEDLEFFLVQPPVLVPVEMYDLARDPNEKENISDARFELANQIIQKIQLIYKEAKKRKTGKMEMNEELKKQLEALGYIR